MAYWRSLAARGVKAYSQLHGKITTNEVRLGELDGQVQELAGKMQNIPLELEGGKLLDAERTRALGAYIFGGENATLALQEEISHIAQEL